MCLKDFTKKSMLHFIIEVPKKEFICFRNKDIGYQVFKVMNVDYQTWKNFFDAAYTVKLL
jgi:hypothetical protein